MSKEQLKSALIRDKLFLKELYESNSLSKSKRILNFANDGQLVTLIKYLNLLSTGVIKIQKRFFDALEKRHLAFMKKHFEKKTQLQHLLASERKQKLKILLRLSSIFAHLLAPLFNE